MPFNIYIMLVSDDDVQFSINRSKMNTSDRVCCAVLRQRSNCCQAHLTFVIFLIPFNLTCPFKHKNAWGVKKIAPKLNADKCFVPTNISYKLRVVIAAAAATLSRRAG